MIIGFDGSRAFATRRTGTENYSYYLLKALAKIDKKNTYNVYLRTAAVIPSKEGIYMNNLYGSPIKSGMTMEGWPKNFKFVEISWPRLWTQGGLAIQTFTHSSFGGKDNLDVLFVPSHTLPLIRKPGLKTVLTVHDLGAEYLPKMHQIKQRLYLKWISNYQLKSATKLIAVSKATKDDLIKKVGVSPSKVEVIYEGFNQDLKQVKGDILVNSLRQYGVVSGEYFLFVGTVQPRKNLTRLIEAFSRVIPDLIRDPYNISGASLSSGNVDSRFRGNDKVQLVIVGQKGWLADEIFKLPKKLGIEKRVKFLGYVPDKDMAALYSGAKALVFPSLFEGFGLPILEAQACGCLVITSNISSMPEVGGEGALYVNPYSTEDIIRGMEEVQSSKFKVQSLRKKGFENIKRFSWEKCARETLKVLQSL